MSVIRSSSVAALALCLAACSASSSSSSSTTSTAAASAAAAANSGKVIGVSIQNREAQFYQDMESGMNSEAAKYGYTVKVVDASRDNSKQQSQVEDFISQKVAAIVLTPYDSQASGSASGEANNAGIPVFTADIANASNKGKVVSHIASDNVQGGGQAGKAAHSADRHQSPQGGGAKAMSCPAEQLPPGHHQFCFPYWIH